MRGFTTKQMRMMEMLDYQMLDCVDCQLHVNGKCKPYWSDGYYGSAIIGGSPSRDDIKQGEPFTDSNSDILWEEMARVGLIRERFLILNIVNCGFTKSDTKAEYKPSRTQIKCCNKWYNKYLSVSKPRRILYLGETAMHKIVEWKILEKNAYTHQGYDFRDSKFDMVFSVHPDYATSKGDEGRMLLRKSIEAFRGLSE